MELDVKTLSGGDSGKIAVGFEFVEEGKGNQAVHDTVVAYMAAQRHGTAKTKDRGEVSGTGKKPWRQKGTGRARTGSRRTNIFTGGGVTHGPRPRDYAKKVNSKTRQLALRKALSERIKDEEVVVVDNLKLESHKTKDLHAQIEALAPKGTVLLVTGEADRNLSLAARNIPLVQLVEAESLNTYEVLKPDVIIISKDGLQKIAARLNPKEVK
ncbi:MAG TPA: 50S ribosomal protein L4 [Verrucomicrobiales bacterium]|nr:50S ribosomal protein L4 [Verrucomicrobiales bacterium]HBU59435.1 50S ribosomal protein L4 [Verrucomicrobiales bacterium]|tara:strand:- start:951 stop:1586 length:636 start_codon:yes stop_codon:yes gene_type:complete